MRVEWTAEAEAALVQLVDRVAAWSEAAGIDLARRLDERVTGLQLFPLMGRVVPEYQVLQIRELIEPPYRIIYQVFADRVEIVTIPHSAEDLPTS